VSTEQPIRVLATCNLGLGFSYRGLKAGVEREPHLIACDAGSADFGPYFLGTGEVQKSRATLKRDLSLLIQAAREIGVPFITGSAGGAGARPHVDATVDLVREIAHEQSLNFRLATIPADIPPALVRERLAQGRVTSLGQVADLTDGAIASSSAIVGMMGVEPYIKALEMGAEVIVAGRSTDPAIFAGVPLRAGISPGSAWHASKCIDKGYLATTRPQDGSPVLATISNDEFVIEPTRDGAQCTVKSVATVTLHENPDPFRVAQPTGTIDTTNATYHQHDEHCVRVTGSEYAPALEPTIKLEGAALVGYRKILIAGVRDPRLIERFDEYLDAYRAAIARAARSLDINDADYRLQFRTYGKDAVMGSFEPLRDRPSHEVGLIVDIVGRTREIASALASRLGPSGSRLDIVGRMGGGGNFAYPFSPSLIDVGPVYEWSIWHLMGIDEPELVDLFPVEMQDV
tara:strand:- start:17458 stop:18834 length:1377 start_codon:yes stop_codon:yes gene_type:complete